MVNMGNFEYQWHMSRTHLLCHKELKHYPAALSGNHLLKIRNSSREDLEYCLSGMRALKTKESRYLSNFICRGDLRISANSVWRMWAIIGIGTGFSWYSKTSWNLYRNYAWNDLPSPSLFCFQSPGCSAPVLCKLVKCFWLHAGWVVEG